MPVVATPAGPTLAVRQTPTPATPVSLRRPPKARKPAALGRLDRDRLQWAIRQVVPSHPWYEACQTAIEAGDARGNAADPAAELEHRGVFPPGPGRLNGASPVNTPMVPCQSRACTGHHGRGRLRDKRRVHKHYPHYAVAGETATPSLVEVSGVAADDGADCAVRVEGRTRRDAFAAARAAGVEPTALRVVRRGRRLRLCDDCRISLQEALAARERARERREAEAAGEVPETDHAGRAIVEEPEAGGFHQAMEDLRILGVEIAEPKLPPEDEVSLRAEVDRYLAAAGGTPVTLAMSFA